MYPVSVQQYCVYLKYFKRCVCVCVLQHTVEVLSLLSDDVETDDATPGENLKLRLKGIEEEEILPGFILCSPDNLCHSGRTFDAQVRQHQMTKVTAGWHLYCFFSFIVHLTFRVYITWWGEFVSRPRPW